MASHWGAVSSSGTMVGMEEDAEKPSPSHSLLQRLKSLREWQEKQQQKLLQAHAHTHTPTGPNFTPLKEEAMSNFSESVVKEDSTPPFTLVPIRVEDDHTSAGLPGVGSASIALTHFHIQAEAPESPSKEVDVQPRKSEARDQLPLHSSHAPGKLDPIDRQADLSSQADDTDDWQHSPLISTGLSMAHNVLNSPQNDLKECNTSDEKNVRETEHGTLDTEDTKEKTQSSLHTVASSFPQESPSDYMDESMEDLFGGEKRAPYRSEKYKSFALSKKCLKVTESSQSVKNLVPSRSFFPSLNEGPKNGPEGMEEIPGPRYRFLRKGEGTSRFGMRPMRLKRQRAEDNKPSHLPHTDRQGHGEIPQMPSSVVSAPMNLYRLPMQTLQLERVPQRMASSVLGGRASCMDEQVHGAPNCCASPESVSTQSTNHPTTLDPVRPPPDPLRELEKQQHKEEAELSAFEKLEELAEDSSFSSNSSTVWHLLRQGQQSISSTPLRTPPPLALQETPVVGSENLGAESHSFVGNLINRVLPPSKLSQHQQAVAQVDVKEVLAQLKAIVRLEGHSISDVTESEIQSFLEGCSSQHPSEASHPTSTPAPPHPLPLLQARPHHVHFNSEGVQVMEYELSDTEGEDTLTDATSLDSDMITTSDLEALTQLSVKGACVDPQRQGQSHPFRESNISDSISSGEATLTEQEVAQKLEGVVLHFSPPPPRPAQSASNYIWSIFGKERDTKKHSAPKAFPKNATKEVPRKLAPKPQETKRMNMASVLQCGQKEDASQELEVHKTLLLGKVAELERETKLFKEENSKLERLQQQAQEERQKLEKEKCRIQEEAASERKKFQEYVDRERNALWREKQQVIQRPFSVTQPQDDLMVVRLNEQIRNLQEEAGRKESLNQFTVKKLNDKIKALENENKKLKERIDSLQALEKENQDLRLKVDKARAGRRTKPTQPAKPTQSRTKAGTKSMTVDGVTKTLERLSRPQPVIIREAQTNPGKKKQDLANNNLSLEATEDSEDALAKQRSNTEAPACHKSPAHEGTPAAAADEGHTNSLADPLRQTDTLSLWAGPDCPEEAGLEHTERIREDGILEVIYANGNRKEIHPSGEVTMSFYNGDRKEIHPDKTVYVYGSDHTSHTTYLNGREELIFPNGQQETRHPDGSSEISFPDGSRKCVLSDGTEICTTKDGSVVRTNPDGSKVFEFPSGQREVHHGGEKRREYPNGTVKIVHPDGRTETRYNSGRIRIKDREGNVILDTHITLASPPPLYS